MRYTPAPNTNATVLNSQGKHGIFSQHIKEAPEKIDKKRRLPQRLHNYLDRHLT
jgi:hypothetical protein